MFRVAAGIAFAVLIGAASTTPARAIPAFGVGAPIPTPPVVLAHGNHSLCAAGHRHDWDGRKIRCHPCEYIFDDGPRPQRRHAHKRKRRR
jgi:hypothetical protein